MFIKVDITTSKLKKGQYVQTDWNIYTLILFNIIQNAVKYNNQNGKIEVSIDFEK